MVSIMDPGGAPPEFDDDTHDIDSYDDLGLDLDAMFQTDRQKRSARNPAESGTKHESMKLSSSPRVPSRPSQTSMPTPTMPTMAKPDTVRQASIGASRPHQAFDWGGFDQMAELQRTNAALLDEVDNLRVRLKSVKEEQVTAGGNVVGAGAKISVLSRKNRELTAAVNSEKARAATANKETDSLRKKIEHMETMVAKLTRSETVLRNKLRTAEANATTGTPNASSSTTSPPPSAHHSAKPSTKGGDAEKLVTYRRECQTLRRDLKLAQSALAKELGSDVPVSTILAGESTWKGRAEQIRMLKTRLENMQRSGDGHRRVAQRASTGASERNAQGIRLLELQKKRELEKVSVDNDALKQQNTDLRQKTEGLKARIKTLTRELKTAKDKLQAALKEADDERRKVGGLKERLVDVARDAGRIRKPILPAPRPEEIASLQSLLRQKDAKIASLEERLRDALNRLRHIRPTSGSSSASGASTHAVLPPVGVRPGRNADTTDRGGLHDVNVRVAELEALMDASALEAQELSSVIATLKTRNESSANKVEEALHALHQEKAISRRLREQLEDGAPPGATVINGNTGDLKEKLQIQQEDNHALRITLEETIKAKEAEITLMHKLLVDTKRVFSEALRHFKQTGQFR